MRVFLEGIEIEEIARAIRDHGILGQSAAQQVRQGLEAVAAALAREPVGFPSKPDTWEPWPTKWAYAKVCEANEAKRQKIEALEKSIDDTARELHALRREVLHGVLSDPECFRKRLADVIARLGAS